MLSWRFWSIGLAALSSVSLPAVTAQNTLKGPCQQLAEYQGSVIAKNQWPYSNDIVNIRLNAEMAYNCTTSVPLVPDDALKAINYLKNYTDFDTTLSFLRNPPESYQKPGVDIIGRLDQVADNVRNKKYKNQYEFELDIQAIAREASEGHFNLNLGLFGVFVWTLNDTIISLSKDGKELPQIYAFSDIKNQVSNPSPIVELGGKPVFEYLRSYLERSVKSGFIEAHADWNTLVYNGAYSFGSFGTDIRTSWVNGKFQQTSVYNGKSLQVRYANGSDAEWLYDAGSYYDLFSKNMTSAANIYNNIVANTTISSGVQTRSDELIDRGRLEPVALGVRQQQNTPTLKPYTSVPLWNYPKNPDILEVNFGIGGIVSGYILKNDSVGVLSLPSYDRGSKESLTSALNYTSAVADFIAQAKTDKVKKIVIDLSGNGGGSTFLGYAVFKLFFPSIEPSLLGRVRATSYTNTIGSLVTGILQDQNNSIPEEIWQTTNLVFGGTLGISAFGALDADGHEFASWKDFYGPRKNNNDSFTNGAKYNLSNPSVARDLGFVVPGYDPDVKPTPQDQLWAPEDIILLHDGVCASTCAIFSELMKTDAGVKSVAVGGIPQYGPMQGVAGTRGSLRQGFDYYSELIENIRLLVNEVGNTATDLLKTWGISLDDIRALPLALNTSPLLISGTVNALDMVRVSSLDAPLQFTYQASDCRLFYTFDMAQDVTALWRAVGKVSSGDTSACVDGSTEAPGADRNVTLLSDPGYSYNSTWERANSTEVPDKKGSGGNSGGNDDSGAAGMSVGFSGLLAIGLAVALAF